MNLVEANIREIHSEEIYVRDNKTYVKVDITINTWGRVQRREFEFRLSKWEDAKAKMMFLW